MEDVLTVYKRPYDAEMPVVCMDEARKQHVKAVKEELPAIPGKVRRYDYEYERNGVSNLFMFFEPLAGKRHVDVTDRHTKQDWAEEIRSLVDIHYTKAKKIVLVMDNLRTHRPEALYERFEPQEARRLLDRLEFHYTPKHASWLNMAEIDLSALSRECLDRRIPDQNTLKSYVAVWEKNKNSRRATVNWHFTAHDARIKLKRLYPTIAIGERSETEH